MSLIDEYTLERTCTYKGETYRVRDNGAVYRQPRLQMNVWREERDKWLYVHRSASCAYNRSNSFLW